MERLLLIGEDIALLARLAAGLRGRYRQITLAHCDDAAARASEISPQDECRTIVCLADARLGLGLFETNRALAFIAPAGPGRDALAATGARCFDPGDDPLGIAAVLAPRREARRPLRRVTPLRPRPSPPLRVRHRAGT